MRSALILQDDEQMARAMDLYLAADGFACDIVETGEEAVELARTNPYDVLLIDDFVPGAAGFDVIRAIRAQGCRTPIIFVSSGCYMWGDTARESGADDLLQLPFTREMVRACVRTWVLQRETAGVGKTN
jgi:DNA-binding response OmpR family regulator